MKKVLLVAVVCLVLCFATAYASETEGLTRSEFCTQMYSIVKYTDCMGNVEITKTFEDCDDKAVNELCTLGVAFGKEDGMFYPDDKITREEAVAIYGRLCKYMNLPMNLSEYAYSDDSDIAQWAKEDVYTAYHAGILGESDTFDADGSMTTESTDEISKKFYNACTGDTYPSEQ